MKKRNVMMVNEKSLCSIVEEAIRLERERLSVVEGNMTGWRKRDAWDGEEVKEGEMGLGGGDRH